MKGAPGLLLVAALLGACGGETHPGRVPVPGREGATKSSAEVRAQRRAYDGAPPSIPHENLGMACMNCHTMQGLSLPDVGFAPAMPHGFTTGLSAVAHCTQCHAFRRTDAVFRRNDFAGLRQDLRKGRRAALGAPPVLPHPFFMRENCAACHTGPAAREEIRCTHPERIRCSQCHVEQVTTLAFRRE